MNAKLSRIFLAFTILILISVIGWLLWPSPYRVCHFVLVGMGRGNVYPKIAKFKPYKGKTMGGAPALAAALKEEIASFSVKNEPYCFISLGAELSGTAEAYMTKGSAVIKAFEAMNLNAMLLGNIDFAYGKQRLAELHKQTKVKFLSSNIIDSATQKAPEFITDELILKLDDNLNIGLLGVSPVDTPNLTAKEDVAGLDFLDPEKILKGKVASLRSKGADIVALLTQYNKEYISGEEWNVIASAAPDICFLLDTDIESNSPVVKDGVIVYSISGYNQTKELDFLNIEVTKQRPTKIVGISGKRIGVNLAEYDEDAVISKIVDEATVDFRKQRDTVIGKFATDVSKSFYNECPIGNMVADAMLGHTGAEIAFQNSGSIRNDIVAGKFTVGDLYSVMPFGSKIVTMDLKGSDILELLNISASRKRGILQVSGLNYVYSYRSKDDYKLISALVDGKEIIPDKYYKVVTNNFLADGGDNYIPFANGKNVNHLGGLRDLVKDYISSKCASGSIKIQPEGRIKVEE